MPRLNPVQKAFLKSFLTKILLFPALFFFIKAIEPLGTDLIYYIMATTFDWLLFLVSVIAVVMIELLSSNPEIRGYFFHLDRDKQEEEAGQQETTKPSGIFRRKKEKRDEQPVY